MLVSTAMSEFVDLPKSMVAQPSPMALLGLVLGSIPSLYIAAVFGYACAHQARLPIRKVRQERFSGSFQSTPPSTSQPMFLAESGTAWPRKVPSCDSLMPIRNSTHKIVGLEVS
jgi:hypothetical protein